MKKVITTILSLGIFSVMVFASFFATKANAQTFGELKKELSDEQRKLKENQQQQNLTEEQMQKVNSYYPSKYKKNLS